VFWTIYRVRTGTLTSGTHRKGFRWYNSVGYKNAGTSSWKVESTRLWHFWISDPALLIKDGCGSCHWTNLIFNKPSIFSIKKKNQYCSLWCLDISPLQLNGVFQRVRVGILKILSCQLQCHKPVIAAIRRLRQRDCKFESSLDYILNSITAWVS
jgi:hypothetical protein